jgi:hypothetical protein
LGWGREKERPVSTDPKIIGNSKEVSRNPTPKLDTPIIGITHFVARSILFDFDLPFQKHIFMPFAAVVALETFAPKFFYEKKIESLIVFIELDHAIKSSSFNMVHIPIFVS